MTIKSIVLGSLFLIIILISCKEETVEPTFYGKINGLVVDSENGTPLSNVLIITTPSTSSLTTGDDGKFLFDNIESGEYSIIAEKDGFIKKTVSVTVENNISTSATIQLTQRTSEETNTAPNKPILISPTDNSEDNEISTLLSWSAYDEDNDTLFYDLILFSTESSEKIIVLENSPDTSYKFTDLNYSENYFWQVAVTDNKSEKVNGDIWSFSTREYPNYPILFVSNSNGNYEIYTTDIDTTTNNVVKLSNSNSNEFWPRFNPTRNLIAFVNDINVDKHIYSMVPGEKNIFQVTQIPIEGFHNNGTGFCWAPSGNEIFYSNYEKLYKVNSDGTNLTQVAVAPNERNFREIDISPSGEKIAVLTIGQNFYDSEIYVMNIDGSDTKLIVDNLDGAVQNPIFTTDEKSLLFTHDNSEYISNTKRMLDNRIYKISLETSEMVDLSVNKSVGTNDLNPKISPTGSGIIFENMKNDNSEEGEIMIMNIDGSSRRILKVNGRMPDWK